MEFAITPSRDPKCPSSRLFPHTDVLACLIYFSGRWLLCCKVSYCFKCLCRSMGNGSMMCMVPHTLCHICV